MKRILVINGNPKKKSLCRALAEAYAEGAKRNGHAVQLVHLREMEFQPVLRSGYDDEQPLEPDLASLQESLGKADHLVIVYPVWWGTVPALLKGMLDRILLPGFAFRFLKGSSFPKKLLVGKTARLIETMDTPPWFYSLVQGAPAHKMMRKAVLQFCGISPVRITALGPVASSTETKRTRWMEAASALGRKGA